MRKLIYPLLLCTAALIAAFVVIVSYESYYLTCVEELSLFLYTPQFLSQKLVVAGGMLSYVGTWLTQFLFVPWQGALVICLFCALLMVLMQQVFRLSPLWAPLLLSPLAAVLLSDFMLGYWIYLLKMPGYFFGLAVGSIVTLLALWPYRWLIGHRWWLRAAWMVLTGVVLYPLVGCYGLVALMLMIAMEWRYSASSVGQKATLSVLTLLLLLAVPLICYRYIYDQTPIENIWWCGIPQFTQGDKSFPIYYLPYFLMLGAAVVSLIPRSPSTIPSSKKEAFPLARPKDACKAKTSPTKGRGKSSTTKGSLKGALSKGGLWSVIGGCFILAALIFLCNKYWYKDELFHKEIQMDACVEQCKWQETLDIAATVSNPTRQIVLYKYLALFKMGRIGEEMYDLPDGGVLPNCPAILHLVQLGGQQLYMHYGMQNFCYRWCVEDGVEYGWRIRNLRLMVRCALLNHEWNLAQKFIDLLRHTRNHAQWAEEYQPLVGHPELIASHRELGPITHVIGDTSVLASDQALLEKFMLTILSNLYTDDPIGAELALMSAVQLKDIPTFWRTFNQYAITHPDTLMPRIYQEAAYLYGHLENKVDISHMPFEQSVKDDYEGFMKLGQQCQSMSEAQMRDVFRPKYGRTFYYNYFLVRGLRTY